MKHEERKEFILQAALEVAEECGIANITREKIANHANISSSLIQYHFREMDTLRKAIPYKAIKEKNIPVVAQLLGSLDISVLSAPECLRKKALNFIANAQVQNP